MPPGIAVCPASASYILYCHFHLERAVGPVSNLLSHLTRSRALLGPCGFNLLSLLTAR